VLLALAATSAAAQERVWRLGILTPGTAEAEYPGSLRGTALPALAERGFVEGRNLVVLVGAGRGDFGLLPQLGRWLADQRVDVFIAVGLLATSAAMEAAPDTPIVMSFASQDPVETGHVQSLARPGGRVTGIFFRAIESDVKRLALLAESLPGARVLGFLAAAGLEPKRAALLDDTAKRHGMSLMTQVVQGKDDYARAFEAFKAAGAAGVLVMGTTVFSQDAALFGELGAQHGIATMCEWDFMVRDGCLLGFGPDLVALRRQTAEYVVRILNGDNAGDLPIEQPDRFSFAVNVRAAAALGLTIPPALLLRADELIE
jgi:putative tryptophan/tyrosine transport system substrate-binding protein